MSDRENFVFYASWIDILKAYDASDPSFAGELAKQMIYFGVEGKLSTDDPIITGLIQSMCATLIDKSKKRHKACIDNGKRGGRPKQYNDEEIQALYQQGISVEDIAQQVGCSVKTVQRALTNTADDEI